MWDELHVRCHGESFPDHVEFLVMYLILLFGHSQEVTLLSFISICAGADWDLSDSQVATISSSVFVGILLGNLFWGPVAGAALCPYHHDEMKW